MELIGTFSMEEVIAEYFIFTRLIYMLQQMITHCLKLFFIISIKKRNGFTEIIVPLIYRIYPIT